MVQPDREMLNFLHEGPPLGVEEAKGVRVLP